MSVTLTYGDGSKELIPYIGYNEWRNIWLTSTYKEKKVVGITVENDYHIVFE